jgi:hypothetical protein
MTKCAIVLAVQSKDIKIYNIVMIKHSLGHDYVDVDA